MKGVTDGELVQLGPLIGMGMGDHRVVRCPDFLRKGYIPMSSGKREPAGLPDTARPADVGAGITTMRVLDDPELTVKECAELTGMSANQWRSYVSSGYVPKPDNPGDLDVPANRRSPKWRRSTVARFVAGRRAKDRKPARRKVAEA